MSAAERERLVNATRVFEFMAKRKLELEDLLNHGGAELKSPDAKIAEKARRVEKCWELMAQLSLDFVHLENGMNSTWRSPFLQAPGNKAFLEIRVFGAPIEIIKEFRFPRFCALRKLTLLI
jgi:hypothetical protein